MNANIFMNRVNESDIINSIIKVIDTEDLVGAVLRVHLISELLIDSWICARTDCNELFGTREDDRLQIECSKKISLARNLGLPKEICTLLKKLNKVRNDFAHKIESSDIDDKDMLSLIDLTKNLSSKLNNGFSIKTTTAFYRKDGSLICEIHIDESSEFNKFKLIIVINILIMAFTQDVSSKHTGAWDKD